MTRDHFVEIFKFFVANIQRRAQTKQPVNKLIAMATAPEVVLLALFFNVYVLHDSVSNFPRDGQVISSLR